MGLHWLFMLRGPIAPPDQVVLITIETESAAEMNLHRTPDRWPRSLHAELISRLVSAGASVIAFDLFFDLAREPEEDRALAEAVAAAGNVVLLERLDTKTVTFDSTGRVMQVEERIPPIASLQASALGTAPFPLPRVPEKVSQFWVFGPADPGALTLPAMVLHAHARDVQGTFLSLLDEARPGSAAALLSRAGRVDAAFLSLLGSGIRQLFENDDTLARDVRSRLAAAEGLSRRDRSKLKALVAMYDGGPSRYLNFFGPARTIRSIPYHRVIDPSWDPAAAALDGKVVLVGYSDPRPVQRQDEFSTVVSNREGVSLGGAEIGATAFANLIEANSIEPLSIPRHFGLVFIWGIGITAVLIWLPARIGAAAVVLAGLGYFAIAVWIFESSNLWLPLIMPVFGQIPLALLSVFIWKYAQARAQSEKHRQTLGFYLPAEIVEEFSRSTRGRPGARLLYGTCLATDIEDYTGLSERLEPDELHSLLNEYYALLFIEVERRGGYVADAVGDSMIAVWTSSERDIGAQSSACRASAAILGAVEKFNAARIENRLPTRIGVHTGRLSLGNIGADSHLEYRAVGDIVNTASRIQGLNKHLDTDLLVSSEVLDGTGFTFSRPLGKFLLAGKTTPLLIHDMVSFDEPVPAARRELARLFGEGLSRFHSRRWQDAAGTFERVLAGFRSDGPSRFYLRLCRRYMVSEPKPGWQGAVPIADK